MMAGRYYPAPAQPNIRTSGGGGWAPLGGAISSGATLSGARSPSGNITFKLYASLADCNADTNVLFSDTVPVNSGNGWYPFYNRYAPTSVGTYYWIASYSGDSNNQAATGACSSGVEVVKPPPPPETTQEETTSILEEGELASPPDSTLSYGGREVRVSVSASYCWGTSETSMCADGVPTIPPRKQTLYVPSGSKMVFRYEAPRPPKKVSISAASFDEKGPFGEPQGSRRSLKAYGSGVERTIRAELPPGEYGVYVNVTDPQGDIYYLFRVMVE